MYIPMIVVILLLIVWACYSTYKYNRTRRVFNDIIKSYDEVVTHLISFYLHSTEDKKEQKKIARKCAKAVVDAAGQTVTNHSLMGTTDILYMCKIFRRSFTMREKLTTPYYEFNEKYDKELEKIEKAATEDIEKWFGC